MYNPQTIMHGDYKFRSVLEEIVGDKLQDGVTEITLNLSVITPKMRSIMVLNDSTRHQEIHYEVSEPVEYTVYTFNGDYRCRVELEESPILEMRRVMDDIHAQIELATKTLVVYRYATHSEEFTDAKSKLDVLLSLLDE